MPKFSSVFVKINQIREEVHDRGLSHVLQHRFYWNRVLVPVSMDLTGEIPVNEHPDPGYTFQELCRADITGGKFSFAHPPRHFRALHYFEADYRSFIVIKDDTIVADVWCTKVDENGKPDKFHESYKIGFECRIRESHAFDMYIAPDFRGDNLAVPLMRYLHLSLKADGYVKVYGSYWQDNISALWMHRSMKFHEHPKRKVIRLLSYKRSKEVIE